MNETQQTWDFVIIGAGAAGCVVASRLSANPANKVLLLEAGKDYAPGIGAAGDPRHLRRDRPFQPRVHMGWPVGGFRSDA